MMLCTLIKDLRKTFTFDPTHREPQSPWVSTAR
jgi:hypothetical protein